MMEQGKGLKCGKLKSVICNPVLSKRRTQTKATNCGPGVVVVLGWSGEGGR